MKNTPLSEVTELEDGMPIPSIAGTVKVVFARKSGQNDSGEWSFQDFILSDGDSEVVVKASGLDDLSNLKGKQITIECNKSDKHGLTGVKKLVDEYKGKVQHKVKLTPSCQIRTNGVNAPPARNNAPATSVEPEDGILAAKRHLMQSCSLYVLAIKAVETIVIPEVPKAYLTPETWDSIVGRLHTGAHVQGFAKGLPARPLKEESRKQEREIEIEPDADDF